MANSPQKPVKGIHGQKKTFLSCYLWVVLCPPSFLWHFLGPVITCFRCCQLSTILYILFQATVMLRSWSPCSSAVLIYLLSKWSRRKPTDALWVIQVPNVLLPDFTVAEQFCLPPCPPTIRFIYSCEGEGGDSFP